MIARSRRPIAIAWRWSPWLTVPVAALYLYWLLSFAGRFADFRLRHDLTPYPFGFATEGGPHARQLVNDLRLRFHRGVPDSLPVLQLAVRADRLASLDADLPESGFREVKAQLLGERGWQDIGLRYRGDFWYHWAYAKKSLRVAVKDQQLAFGMSTFHLIAPKLETQINDHAAYMLARMLGVLAPRAETVVLYVNGENRGIYQAVQHPDESLLRDLGRMPGDLYVGELVARDAWGGIDNFVFDHPDLWSKMAVNNHLPVDNRGPLRALCALLNAPPSDAVAAGLEQLVDLDACGRFLAAEALLQCLHNDEAHNWRLHYDAFRQRFEPLLWDPNAWGSVGADVEAVVSLDPAASRLHALVLAHPRVLRARAATLQKFLHGGGSEQFLGRLRELSAQAAAVVDLDPQLRPPEPAAVQAALRALPDRVARTFAAIAAAQTPPAVRWSAIEQGIRLQVQGRVPVTAVELQLQAPAAPATRLELRHATGDGIRTVPLVAVRTAEGTGLRAEVTLPAQLLPAPTVGPGGEPRSTRALVPAVYELRASAPLPPLRSVIVVGADGSEQPSERQSAGLPLLPLELLLGVGNDQPPPTETWSGLVVVDALRTVAGDLYIEPGTEVRFAAGAGLVVRGRLFADGSAAQPIRFGRRDPDTAWSSLVLLGERASGSRLAHCEFQGGSGRLDPEGRFDYSGVLAIHEAKDVRVEHSTFTGSSRADDVVHAVYADVTLEHCQFGPCPNDALDFDCSQGAVVDCEFADCTNDGIEVMTSDVVVHRCTFTRCDQGLSVGERSRALVAGSRFVDCMRGVRVMDDADAVVGNCSLQGGERAFEVIADDWRYGQGGRLQAHRSLCLGAATPPAADASSKLLLRDCALSPMPTAQRNLELQHCDSDPDAKARLPEVPLPLPIAGRQSLASSVWNGLDRSNRGAP